MSAEAQLRSYHSCRRSLRVRKCEVRNCLGCSLKVTQSFDGHGRSDVAEAALANDQMVLHRPVETTRRNIKGRPFGVGF
jgi:hypothetical protein